VGPIAASERILFIDVLRGMALFGIFAANMRAFFAPLDAYGHIGVLYPGRADVLVQALIDTFVQGKFVSIFSFLFGMVPPASVSSWAWAARVLRLPGASLLSAGYVAALALVFRRRERRQFFLPFAAVGRMALTNYLMQSVLCTLFFYHYTTGWYGRIGPAVGLAPTVLLYAGQVGFSCWWLGRYRFGPMEWLWRSLTYGRMPSLRYEEISAGQGVPSASSPTVPPAIAGEHSTASNGAS
jgi:uncharacterized membrane protein YeiB